MIFGGDDSLVSDSLSVTSWKSLEETTRCRNVGDAVREVGEDGPATNITMPSTQLHTHIIFSKKFEAYILSIQETGERVGSL